KYQYDAYLKQQRPAFCMALPSILEGKVRAILYLENQELVTPLSLETIQTLRLLLMQTAIIYKNTSLYETLLSNERALNKSQQIAHMGSWQFNSATQEVIWSEEMYRIYELEPFSIPITYEWIFEHTHSDDIHLILDSQEKILSGQSFCDTANRIITAKGNIKIVHQRGEVYWSDEPQMISGITQDITERKKDEDAIEMLTQVVNQTPFSTIITNTQGVIEYTNNQTSKLTGYFHHELLGKKISLFQSGVHPQTFYQELWETITKKRSFWRGVIINKMKNGELRDCASTIFPIFNTQNEIVNFVTIQDDVTERNMKDKLFLMQTRQAQMGEMLSMIAHQWRQPLAIISALMSRQKINIMLGRGVYEDIAVSFDEIETQVQHLSRTITDFKDFFKPDKKRVLTNSKAVISKVFDLIEHSLMSKNVSIEKNISDETEYECYENELIQVLLNLIKNAQDVFEERGIRNPVIRVNASAEDAKIIIRIDDNAGGIAPEIMDALFAPYASTKKENGTGLGLYMSKTIIEEHFHGEISANNTTQGACFEISFLR
ncbi:MAG: PAS domain S-box protein, partial [Sulfurimonas sp.]|nr:PAS domain S-box protein [Sulfurimonas sp.]